MAQKIRLDSRGIAEVLNSAAVYAATQELADSVAGAVDAEVGGEKIDVTQSTRVAEGGRLRSPRKAVDIHLAHPAGLRVEAKRGPLAKAAASRGLQVRKRRA
ncbi:hypothetical protein PQD82_gp12 [Arthrobacter phage Phives]|uniref:Uncharacterized protein n=1 Tax=Arthrobacter phage Phives TaxID=2776856 RepID=A0A7M1CL37_9CAUD|nr:hypothetical protein PQD82_gp12 [Arthrobacter phage Phives]QOP65140.1 hypothetical protein SEA_PHIVES_12 [Arthrobacter phage Phives]